MSISGWLKSLNFSRYTSAEWQLKSVVSNFYRSTDWLCFLIFCILDSLAFRAFILERLPFPGLLSKNSNSPSRAHLLYTNCPTSSHYSSLALKYSTARYWTTRNHLYNPEPAENYSNYPILILLSISSWHYLFLPWKTPRLWAIFYPCSSTYQSILFFHILKITLQIPQISTLKHAYVN